MYIIYEYINSSPAPIKVIIEPWAEEFDIDSQSKIEIKILFQVSGKIQTRQRQGVFEVYLWVGCTAEVVLDGITIDCPFLNTPVPL
jgi:hypothetical protein